ncbi:MAG: TlpA disulfide reductase family protein [Bacteroidales bacterium]|nr:TlpA disulfide reductase family protein [Bacteroidales bacterium]
MKNILFAFIFVAIAFNSSAINSVPKVASQKVPSDVSKWIKKELSKAKTKKLIDLNTSAFFCRDSARLIGYIIGYDSLKNEKTGMIYAGNVLTHEDNVIVIQIYPDGRFEATFPINHPQQPFMILFNKRTTFYIEPGQTLGMIIGDETEFVGPAAQINKDLNSISLKEMEYNSRKEKEKTMNPVEYKADMEAFFEECKADLEKQLQGKKITPQAESLLRNEVLIQHACYILGYEWYVTRQIYMQQDTAEMKKVRVPITDEFFDFLRKMPLNDQKLLASGSFAGFINQLEFCDPFFGRVVNNSAGYVAPEKSFDEYVFDELKLNPTEEDLAFKVLIDSAKTLKYKDFIKQDSIRAKSFYKRLNEMNRSFEKKHEAQQKDYQKKYRDINKPLAASLRIQMANHLRDSNMTKLSGIKPNLVEEIILTRSLEFDLKHIENKDRARQCLTNLDNSITHPFLIDEGERLFNKLYPSVQKTAYELPSGKGTDILRKIIDPFKGKMVVIDFWATTCGPCVGSIRNMKAFREEMKENKELVFVFITSEGGSPKDAYDKFVKDQDLVNTYRVTEDEDRYLCQLFQFNGIPHYVLIDKDGKVANADYSMGSLKMDIENRQAQ